MTATFPSLRLLRHGALIACISLPLELTPAIALQGKQSGGLPCGQLDDGSTETAFGVTGGGELGWLHEVDCLQHVLAVRTAYGSALFPGSVTNGAPSQIAVYVDASPDGDPRTDLTRVAHVQAVVVNGDTDILNPVVLPEAADIACEGWILASAEHAKGEFPAGWDGSNPFANSWGGRRPGGLSKRRAPRHRGPEQQQRAAAQSGGHQLPGCVAPARRGLRLRCRTDRRLLRLCRHRTVRQSRGPDRSSGAGGS